MENTDYTHLLNEYRTLWNNRALSGEGMAEEVLKEAIARELKDENSHPRVRKSIYEKFYFAVKRVMDSNLSKADQNALIQIHIEQLEYLKKQGS